MTLYESKKEVLFGKLFSRENTAGILDKCLPWCYTVDFTFFSDDSDILRSGSQHYLGTEPNLHDDVVVRWYFDNNHLDGEVNQVTLSFNSSWSNNPTYKA